MRAYPSFSAGPGPRDEAFRQALRDLGWIEGENIVIEYRWSAGKRKRLRAMAVLGYSLIGVYLREIVAFALKNRLPTICTNERPAKAGLLMSYGANFLDLYRRAATYVDKILKGAKPADLPVEVPIKFDLVINLKTAKALGITIPPLVLYQATRVIK